MQLRLWCVPAIAARLLLAGIAAADPTWPSPTDELEEIMYQLKAFRGRRFADTIDPCTNEASGPGRQNAAEWLRLGFHDMSTANVAAGRGGLDGSIQFMLDNGENLGPGFNNTLKFMSNYLSPRSSISDLIALGVYASVRACGGPIVPVRGGRVDALEAGDTGVPQPEHHIDLFRQQFARMGFTPEEMIQVTACGHTLGRVHRTEFPDLVSEDAVGIDSTVADFDNRVVTEYLEGNTTNPLAVGPAIELGRDSDGRIFNSDSNVTVKALTDPAVFESTCQRILQKMIDVVPAGVKLSEPIQPYLLKPVAMQLTLEQGARIMRLTGYIRVRTTDLPTSELRDIELVYRDRNGGGECGRDNCTIIATMRGRSRGFDDTFAFFPIDTTISTKTGISTFTVTVNLKNGTSLFFDNNGHSYALQDAAMLLRPQSCLLQYTGVFSATAAIRNDRASLPVTILVSYKQPQQGLPVASMHNMTMSMRKGPCVGHYTLYSANWTIPGGLSFASKIDIISGEGDDVIVDDFNNAVELPGTCRSFRGPPENLCEEIETTTPPAPTRPVLSVATTMHTVTSSPAPSSALTSVPTPAHTGAVTTTPASEVNDLGLGHTFETFFEYVTNYVANFFFGYDRWQLVNHKLGRVT